jgi:hypothetical protein
MTFSHISPVVLSPYHAKQEAVVLTVVARSASACRNVARLLIADERIRSEPKQSRVVPNDRAKLIAPSAGPDGQTVPGLLCRV